MRTIRVRQLGLAAYIKVSGGKFIGYREKHFVFESEKSEEEWRVEYMNSSESKFDKCVMDLRDFMK